MTSGHVPVNQNPLTKTKVAGTAVRGDCPAIDTPVPGDRVRPGVQAVADQLLAQPGDQVNGPSRDRGR